MNDLHKQVERLVELDEKAIHNTSILTQREWDELMHLSNHPTTMSSRYGRAYLAECEAHERTQKQLENAVMVLRDLACPPRTTRILKGWEHEGKELVGES